MADFRVSLEEGVCRWPEVAVSESVTQVRQDSKKEIQA